jgi:hypothetical protein
MATVAAQYDIHGNLPAASSCTIAARIVNAAVEP